MHTVIIAQLVPYLGRHVRCGVVIVARGMMANYTDGAIISQTLGVPVIRERHDEVDAVVLCRFHNLIQSLEAVGTVVDCNSAILDMLKPCPILRYGFDVYRKTF